MNEGFAHQVQHLVGTVFRCDFKATGDVVSDDGFQVFPVYRIDLFIVRAMHGGRTGYRNPRNNVSPGISALDCTSVKGANGRYSSFYTR